MLSKFLKVKKHDNRFYVFYQISKRVPGKDKINISAKCIEAEVSNSFNIDVEEMTRNELARNYIIKDHDIDC